MSLVVSPPNFPHQPFSDTDVSYPSTSSSQGSSTTAEQLITPPSPLAALHPFEERPKPLVPFPIFQQRHSSPFPVAQSFSVLGPPSNSSGPSPPPAPKLSTSALPALTPLATPTISEMIVQPTLPPTPDPSPPNSKVLFPDAMIKLAPPATVDHYGFTSIEEIVLGEERPKMMPTISIDPSSRPVSPQIDALTRARSHSHTQPIRPSLGEVAALTSPNVNRKSMGPPPKPMRRSQTAINPSTLRLAESRSESLEARVKGRNLVGMGARQPSSQLAVYNRSSSPGMTRTLTAPTLDSPSDSAVPDMGGPDGLEAKVVLLGSQGVGKTSLILRYTTRVFASTPAAATIGSSLHTRKLVHSGVRVKLQIWDTAGQERFRSMAPIYYRGAHVCVLVYDVSDRSSFDDVRSWLEELGRTVPKETVIYIVGSKIDLESQRVVWPEEAQETIRSWLKPAAPQPPAQTQSHLSPPSSHSRNLLRSSSLASQQPRTAPASILSSPTPTRSHSHTALTTLNTAPSVPAPKAPLVKTSPVKTPAKETVPFPVAPRTRPSSMQITSPRPLSVTVDPTSRRSRKLSFPALQSPTLPTSVTFVEPIKPSLTPASPTSRHGVSAGRFSISGALAFSRTSSISGAASSLARLAEDNPVSPREGPYMPSERHFASKTSSTGRAQSFNSDTPQRARLQSSPALGMGMADANRRRSEDWSAGMNRPWRMGEGPGAAEALGEFGAGVRKKESGELLTTRSTKSIGGITSPSDRTKPTGRARGGSLGRDSRLYGSERGSSDGHEDDAGWGVDIEGMRVGEVSALSGEGVEALFRSVSALLVEKREKIERERTLRRKNSVMLTDPVESQNKDAKVKARGGCC